MNVLPPAREWAQSIQVAVRSEDKNQELSLVESREISSAADSPVMLPNPANLKSQTKHSWL